MVRRLDSFKYVVLVSFSPRPISIYTSHARGVIRGDLPVRFYPDSQNQETRLAERRSRLDLQINLLTEQENTTMLKMLVRIAQKVGADVDSDQVLSVLAASTRPDKLIDQIDNESNAVTKSNSASASAELRIPVG